MIGDTVYDILPRGPETGPSMKVTVYTSDPYSFPLFYWQHLTLQRSNKPVHHDQFLIARTFAYVSHNTIVISITQPAARIGLNSHHSWKFDPFRPLPFFSSQHPPLRSSPASGEQEAADVIHRWIQSLPSDFSPVLSPTLSVKRRLWDEADDDLSYEESDDGLPYQPSLEPAPVNIASVNVSVMALWTTCQQR